MKMKKIIYDFGANNGDNIKYYIQKSDTVIAIEADPKLCDIIKTNNQLKTRIEKPNANEEHLAVITGALQYHIATLIDNQIPGIPPAQQRNGRKLKSVSEIGRAHV